MVVYVAEEGSLSLFFCVVHWRVHFFIVKVFSFCYHALVVLFCYYIVSLVLDQLLPTYPGFISSLFADNTTATTHHKHHNWWADQSGIKSKLHEHGIVFNCFACFLIVIVEDDNANDAPDEGEELVQNVEYDDCVHHGVAIWVASWTWAQECENHNSWYQTTVNPAFHWEVDGWVLRDDTVVVTFNVNGKNEDKNGNLVEIEKCQKDE